jgi:excisionase family DNA binding protein
VCVKISTMNNPLPLPNPYDWTTVPGAAELLGVDRRTVDRLIDKGVLTGCTPYQGKREKRVVILWRAEVIEVRDARRKLAAAGADK